jgi:hypothetical protein
LEIKFADYFGGIRHSENRIRNGGIQVLSRYSATSDFMKLRVYGVKV